MVVVNRSSHSSIAADRASPELGRECPRVLGCVALAAVEAARQPDHHSFHLAIFDLTRDACPQAPRVVGDGGDGRREDARLVGDGDPDPHRADVDPEDARATGTVPGRGHGDLIEVTMKFSSIAICDARSGR